jgi:uncharacterized membrane protein YagU involved in acid resistance
MANRSVTEQGVVAGLWASWIKALSEPALEKMAERIAPSTPEQKEEVGTDPIGHPANMPPAVLVGRVAEALGSKLTDEQRLRAQLGIHYTVGTSFALAYTRIARRWPVMTRGGGALYGLVVYAVGHGAAVPALGIQPPPWKLPPAAILWEGVSHVVYGIALETARRVLVTSV